MMGTRAAVLLALVVLAPVLTRQAYHSLFNNTPVESTAHWLEAGNPTELRLSLVERPAGNVFMQASGQTNCLVIEQVPNEWDLVVLLEASQAGAVVLVLSVYDNADGEQADGSVLASHEIKLQAFEGSGSFPAQAPAIQASAYLADATDAVVLTATLANASLQFPNNPVRPHLLWCDTLPCESPLVVDDVQYDASSGELSVTVIPNAFGFHSLKVPVQFANGQNGQLFFGFAAVHNPPAIHLFPNYVPLGEEVELTVRPNFLFEEGDTFHVADGNGEISAITWMDHEAHLTVTFSALPATLVFSRNGGEVQLQAEAKDEGIDPQLVDFMECLREELKAKFRMNKEEGCIDLVGAIDFTTLRNRLAGKLPNVAHVQVEIEGSDGKPIGLHAYISTQPAVDGKPRPKGPDGQTGYHGEEDGALGSPGAAGNNGSLPGQHGGVGLSGRQGGRGKSAGKGGYGTSVFGPAEAGGTPETWRIIVPRTDCPVLVLVFGGHGRTGGRGGDGGIGGPGGAGASGTENPPGTYVGPGGNGGQGGNGGPGGQGGSGGEGGDGGSGGRGGDGQRVEVRVHELVYLIALEGKGGHGGLGGNGGNRGQPGVPGIGGLGGDAGVGGQGGPGNPAGANGAAGSPGTGGNMGVTQPPGSPGDGGAGGMGGRKGTVVIQGKPCDQITVDGSHGGQGAQGQAGS